MTFLEFDLRPFQLELPPGAQTCHHRFDADCVHAINIALAADRPLLILGEPGTGKSQLARAAAQRLKRVYYGFAVDSQTEGRDLRWTVDAVSRLGKAQVMGCLPVDQARERESELEIQNFVSPGPLWWAFDWKGALEQAGKVGERERFQAQDSDAENGTVILIDEIDKADSSVPNAMLAALGERSLQTPWGEPVQAQSQVPPLIVFTTNEERILPKAFLRRCMVLNLAIPGGDLETENQRDELAEWLIGRGGIHSSGMDAKVLARAAELLVEERKQAFDSPYRPGQAEFLDLLRALDRYVSKSRVPKAEQRTSEQLGLLENIDQFACFALRKCFDLMP